MSGVNEDELERLRAPWGATVGMGGGEGADAAWLSGEVPRCPDPALPALAADGAPRKGAPSPGLFASFSSASARRCEKGPPRDPGGGGGLPPPAEVGGVPTLKVELPGDAARPPEPESGEKERDPRVGERLALA